MRILHVLPDMANSSGPTHVVVHLCERLTELGHKVSIYHVTGRGFDVVRPRRSDIDVQGFSISTPKRWCYSSSLRSKLYACVREFDLVHIHGLWLYPGFTASRSAWREGIPYLLGPHGALDPWCLTLGRVRKAVYMALTERRQLNRAAAIHAMSIREALQLERLGIRAPIVVVPLGVDSAEYRALPPREAFLTRYGIPSDRRLVLFLSRLHPVKGLDILPEALARLRTRLPDTMLVVAGPNGGPHQSSLKREFDRLGIADATLFTGELRGRDKLAAYSAADVFVLPSRSENFGVVVTEAMAASVPVVVSKNTPWEEVESQGAGYWVDAQPEKVAEAIISILDDPSRAKQMGENGRALVEAKYTWDRVGSQMAAVYEEIICGDSTADCG